MVFRTCTFCHGKAADEFGTREGVEADLLIVGMITEFTAKLSLFSLAVIRCYFAAAGQEPSISAVKSRSLAVFSSVISEISEVYWPPGESMTRAFNAVVGLLEGIRGQALRC